MDGLAKLADGPPLERKRRGSHDRLVTDFHRAQAQRAVERHELVARSQDGVAPATLTREATECLEQRPQLRPLSDRIPTHECGASHDAVGKERVPA